MLWRDVLSLMIVESLETQRPLGSVAIYNADFRNGHAKLAASLSPFGSSSRAFLEGLEIFIRYMFGAFPFRKLYGEVLEANLEQFANGPFSIEGRLKEHTYCEGRYQDLIHIALYREEWDGQVHRESALASRMLRKT
jgi:RimJ/RimL family protein N-acetyltransferase